MSSSPPPAVFEEGIDESAPNSESSQVAPPFETAGAERCTKSALKEQAAPDVRAMSDKGELTPTAEANATSLGKESMRIGGEASVQNTHGSSDKNSDNIAQSSQTNKDIHRYGEERRIGEYVVVEFRRGDDNSHMNRMTRGSYSRYLNSCDKVPGDTLVQSFYASKPVLGFVQSHANLQQPSNATASTSSTYYPSIDKERPRTSAGELSGRTPAESMLRARVCSARSRDRSAGRQTQHRVLAHSCMADSSDDTREAHLVGPAMYHALCTQRHRHRRDPRHGRDDTGCFALTLPRHSQKQAPPATVYVNHNSKNCYLPRDVPPQALVLRYNDLYDFGTGTRFRTGVRIDGAGNHTRVLSMKRNPHAGPPMTAGQLRAATRMVRYGGTSLPYLTTAKAKDSDGTHHQQEQAMPMWKLRSGQRQYEAARKNCTSLRNRYAVNPETIHVHQHRHMTTIEEVMANPPRMY